MTLKKLWRVKTDRGTEIWEVYEEDGMGWCAIYKPDRDLVGRSNFLTLEEATEFAEYGLKNSDCEEIPLTEEGSFPGTDSLGCGFPQECAFCNGEAAEKPKFKPISGEDLLVPVGNDQVGILSLVIPRDDVITSQSIEDVEEEE